MDDDIDAFNDETFGADDDFQLPEDDWDDDSFFPFATTDRQQLEEFFLADREQKGTLSAKNARPLKDSAPQRSGPKSQQKQPTQKSQQFSPLKSQTREKDQFQPVQPQFSHSPSKQPTQFPTNLPQNHRASTLPPGYPGTQPHFPHQIPPSAMPGSPARGPTVGPTMGPKMGPVMGPAISGPQMGPIASSSQFQPLDMQGFTPLAHPGPAQGFTPLPAGGRFFPVNSPQRHEVHHQRPDMVPAHPNFDRSDSPPPGFTEERPRQVQQHPQHDQFQPMYAHGQPMHHPTHAQPGPGQHMRGPSVPPKVAEPALNPLQDLPPLHTLLTQEQMQELARLPVQQQMNFLRALQAKWLQERQKQSAAQIQIQQRPQENRPRRPVTSDEDEEAPPLTAFDTSSEESDDEQLSETSFPRLTKEIQEQNKQPKAKDRPVTPSKGPNVKVKSNIPRRKRWKQNKEFMLASDIENIIKNQEYQLQVENLFLEDFYFQNYKLKLDPETVSHDTIYRHVPIHDSFRPQPNPKKKGPKENPWEGVLGRICGSSVRAPRPLLELRPSEAELEKMLLLEKQQKGDDESEDEDEPKNRYLRAIITQTEGLTNVSRIVLLTVEHCVTDLIEIEDLDLITSSLASDAVDMNFNRSQLLRKRTEIRDNLYSKLQVNPSSPSQVIGEEPAQQDQFLVRIANVFKGVKMLVRCLHVLSPQQIYDIAVVLERNLNFIITLENPEDHTEYLKKMFHLLISKINPDKTKNFRGIVNYNSNAPAPVARRLHMTVNQDKW